MPIDNFIQVAKLLVYFLAIIIMISIVIGESPVKLFAGLGAMTAVLMLVFRDSILGFVAGLQLSYNKMMNIGDWVEIPQHNASGSIMEIGLTTVKVRNFDNTITTVPTQSLINESFKNWRGMQESPGRRIKRALYIDMNSIHFCDQGCISRYTKVDYIKDYIQSKQSELDEFNKENVGDPESLVNGRHLTNVGIFRAYMMAYLKNHPGINQNLALLVRQLAPTDSGLPLEIYCFSSEKDWVNYESLQADIFDHLLAVAKEFDLKVFQKPAGFDIQGLKGG
jgi:miniconductance mechanosensitive channel